MSFACRKANCLLLVLCFLSACSLSGIGSQRAVFDATNLHAIAVSPYYIADPREDRIDHAWALTTIAAAQKPFFGFLKPNQMMIDPLFDFLIALAMKPGQDFHGDKSYTSTDSCNGEYRITVDIQPDGNLSGAILYQGYSDNCALSYHGRIPFHGNMDTSTGLTTLNLLPDDLLGRIEGREYTFSGELQLNMNVFHGSKQKYSATATLSIKDLHGPEYQLKNMHFIWDDTSQYAQFSMTGGLYFSQFGNVKVSTDGYLVSYEKNGRPFDGVLIYKGVDETWLRLRFPKPTFPGFFKVDSFNGMETKGNF